MKIGVTFPQTEIGSRPEAIRDFARGIEAMGFEYVSIYEHVLGADITNRPGWTGHYSAKDMFHEPFVLMGYLASVTKRLEFMTGVLVLSQRQTALVAKQAAEVDVLSGGRLSLGIGVGWNAVEFEALGEDFHTRGQKCEEQIAVLRALWTQPSVTFKGRWHTINAAGLNPMPVQRPIPIWIGGAAEVVMRRVGRLADGWLPMRMDPRQSKTKAVLDHVRAYAKAAPHPLRLRRRSLSSRAGEGGRRTLGIEGRIGLNEESAVEWAERTRAWQALGVSHLRINSLDAGFTTAAQHLDALARYLKAIGR
ncbi:MAG: LLM class F420-dependent oxidoreductase [Chloroflexi bacterium]|nr:LLM class F420-dependent oxidoreductase [Chloroflexota bacterium]